MNVIQKFRQIQRRDASSNPVRAEAAPLGSERLPNRGPKQIPVLESSESIKNRKSKRNVFTA